jgi:hypothetical protein
VVNERSTVHERESTLRFDFAFGRQEGLAGGYELKIKDRKKCVVHFDM